MLLKCSGCSKNLHIISLKNIIKISRNMENSMFWYMAILYKILRAHTYDLWTVFRRIIPSKGKNVKLSDTYKNPCRL